MKQRHGKCVYPSLLRATVPMDHNVGRDASWCVQWRQENGSTALKQCGFDRAPVRASSINVGPCHHDEVESASITSDKVLALRRGRQPVKAWSTRSPGGSRNIVLQHERFEEASHFVQFSFAFGLIRL